MRVLPPELKARLESGATTLCRCWQIKRADGVVLGFTDHDLDLTFGGVVFRAGTGLDASALQSGTGLSVDNAQAMGALSDAAVNEDDIRAGRFDRAGVWQLLVDWSRPDLRILMFRGEIGEIRRRDQAFEVELRGLEETLNVPVGRSILRTCDRTLGDKKCGVDLSRPEFRVAAEVVSHLGTRITVSTASRADGWFRGGFVAWESGLNAGLTAPIKSDRAAGGTRVVDLWIEPPFPISVGDGLVLVAGCDKHAETCRVKFANFLNFRGFPSIPGEDWVTAYPKAGGKHDGQSLRG